MTLRVLHMVLSIDDAAGGPASLLADLLPLSTMLGHRSVVLGVRTAPSEVADRMARHARVSTTPHGRVLGRAHTSARLLWRLWRETGRADVVVAHSFFNLPGIVAAACCAVRRRGFVVAPHGCLDPYDTRKHAAAKTALAPLWRAVLARATVWCITEREARELVTYGARPSTCVVPPPVRLTAPGDPATTAELLARVSPLVPAAVGRGGTVVSFVGRFAAKKGLPRLVQAFDDAAGDDDVLVLAGRSDAVYDGHGGSVEAAVARLRRRDQVVLPGWVDPATRAALWSVPAVFVLPSDDENFGMAVAEAMAAGVPVVVSNRVALADVVAESGGGVVTSTDVLDVTAGLRKLLEDPALRAAAGQRARGAVERHFAPAVVAAAWDRLVRSAVTP